MDVILETERLYLRRMGRGDWDALCSILQDGETMYAYEGAFSDGEVQEWLDRQLARYERWGFGLWAVVLKETDEMIGQCGLTMQPWKDREVLEVGYLFQRARWHQGYATEAARACRDYAFQVLGADEVCSIIRDTNTASQRVALRNGMTPADGWTKHYRGVEMPHVRYVVCRKQMKRTPNEECASICGLFCGACPSFPDECHGCFSDFVRKGCQNCADHGFLDCARDHNVTRCYECAEFPCVKLEEFSTKPVIHGICNHANVIPDSLRMREVGVAQWVREKIAEHKCPKCGKLVTWFEMGRHICS